MDLHLIPGENAALQAQELRERATDLANDEFEGGELMDEFMDEFLKHEEEFVDEALEALAPYKWPELTARLQPAAPKLFERIRTKVVTARVETILE